MMESQQAEDLAARLVAQIDAVIGGVDGPTVLAAIEIAATTMATRALAGARQARMLEMIGRLGRAQHMARMVSTRPWRGSSRLI
jgi:hypothetical protein